MLGILMGIMGIAGPALAQAAAQSGQQVSAGTDRSVTQQGDNVRESAPAPAIGFIDSPSVSCYQPNPLQNACYINAYYLSVDGGANYMLYLRWWIRDHLVLNNTGFFQTSMYVPSTMLGTGIKVPCGKLGSGGDPDLGAAYAWTMRAKDSANLTAANYGTAYCPAFTPGGIK